MSVGDGPRTWGETDDALAAGGLLEGDAAFVPAGCAMEPREGVTADAEAQGGREALSGEDSGEDDDELDAAVVDLARVFDPDAFVAVQALPLRDFAGVLHRREVAIGYVVKAIDAGFRRVVEDDTTVERVARAIWVAAYPDVRGEASAATERRWAKAKGETDLYHDRARAAVRALREDTP